MNNNSNNKNNYNINHNSDNNNSYSNNNNTCNNSNESNNSNNSNNSFISNNSIILWDVQNGLEIKCLKKHSDSFALSPDGKIIAKNLRGPALESKLESILK